MSAGRLGVPTERAAGEGSNGAAPFPWSTSARVKRAVRTELVDGTGLEPVAQRPPLSTYVAMLWARRHFIWADTHARVLAGTRGMMLGTAWLVLRPVMDASVYLIMFGLVLKTDRGIPNFLGYLIIGVFMFQFTTRCVSAGGQSLRAGRSLMKSFAFPRAALPIATLMRELLRYAPILGAMIVLVLVIPPREAVTWRWLLVPLVLALQVLLCLGLTLISARLVARVPDLQNVIGFFTRFWLFASAVFFAYDRFVSSPVALRIVEFNPMFVILDITRDCMLYATTPSLESWAVLVGWAVGLAGLGFVFFWRGEERYGAL